MSAHMQYSVNGSSHCFNKSLEDTLSRVGATLTVHWWFEAIMILWF